MTFLVLLWVLAQGPTLGTPVTSRQPDGTWKCSAMCLTSGNADGGQCRTPLTSRAATEGACKANLDAKCAKTKPPPGGCRWGNNPPPVNK